MYLDGNKLYGWAMSEPLPTGGFKWMTPEEYPDWRNILCIVEVDLEYRKELHNLHNDYSLAPEKMLMKGAALANEFTSGVDKLVPNLNNKTKYVVHYRNLKLYEEFGLIITKIHRGFKFEDRAWLKEYIDLNTNFRTKAATDFEKDLFKLMNNSLFGKTMKY